MTDRNDFDGVREYEKNYREGHKNGWHDASNGICNTYSIVARRPGYLDGYKAGQRAYNNQEC